MFIACYFQVCAKEDVERARKMALESIVLSVAARNTKASSVAPGTCSGMKPNPNTVKIWKPNTSDSQVVDLCLDPISLVLYVAVSLIIHANPVLRVTPVLG